MGVAIKKMQYGTVFKIKKYKFLAINFDAERVSMYELQ